MNSLAERARASANPPKRSVTAFSTSICAKRAAAGTSTPEVATGVHPIIINAEIQATKRIRSERCSGHAVARLSARSINQFSNSEAALLGLLWVGSGH